MQKTKATIIIVLTFYQQLVFNFCGDAPRL